MSLYTLDLNGASRAVNCVVTNPLTNDCVIYTGPPTSVAVMGPMKYETSLDADPFFNSAKSLPSGCAGISFDPINKIQVIYPENSLGEKTSSLNNAGEPSVEDTSADSDSSSDSDDEVEKRRKERHKNLPINVQILKELRSLRKHSRSFERKTLCYIYKREKEFWKIFAPTRN